MYVLPRRSESKGRHVTSCLLESSDSGLLLQLSCIRYIARGLFGMEIYCGHSAPSNSNRVLGVPTTTASTSSYPQNSGTMMKKPVLRKSIPRTTMLNVHASIAFLRVSTTLARGNKYMSKK